MAYNFNPSYTDDPAKGFIRGLLVGPSGAGKTHLCGTFPSPYIVDCDKGLATLRDKHLPFFTIEAYTKAYHVVLEIMKAVKMQAAPFDSLKVETLVVDSLTSLSDLMELELVKYPREASAEANKEVMSLPDFRVHRRRILNLVRYAQDLPVHVLFTANLKTDKDEITGSLIQVPSVAGAQLPTEMTALFDEVYYMEYDSKEQEYNLYTKGFRWFKQGKTRFALPEKISDPSWEVLSKAYSAGKKE